MNGGEGDAFFQERVGGDEEKQRKQWLKRTARGDHEAFASLYREFSPRMYGYLRLRIPDDSHIQDLMQDTFVAIWRNAKQYAGSSTVSTWMFGIARYKMLDWLRIHYKSSEREVAWSEELADAKELTEQDFAAALATELSITSALATLPPHYAEVFYLVFVESMNYREVSVLLELPEGTVKSRMHQAKARIRQNLREGGNQDGHTV